MTLLPPEILFKNVSADDIDPKDAPFNYRSVIGSLNHLAQTTRPDISLAVHQCARFCSNPKKIHFTAVKRIVRYLVKTQDKGMILKMSMIQSLSVLQMLTLLAHGTKLTLKILRMSSPELDTSSNLLDALVGKSGRNPEDSAVLPESLVPNHRAAICAEFVHKRGKTHP